MNTAQMITYFDDYMKRFPTTRNANWYIGVTSNVQQRLFTDHQVSKEIDAWAFAPATTSETAREVEKIYLNAGCDGGSGGGDYTTKTVYIYLKSSRTS